ncbi:MAG: GAF domain-containing protein [Bacteroidota bacterium]|nr:GAF domain-containing protein [Bacteroidota bacterium]
MNVSEKPSIASLESLIVKDLLPAGNICNLLGALKYGLDLFWIGIYEAIDDETLHLSYFQGLPACTQIAFGKGVCGTAAETQMTQIVNDVSTFPGYIACHEEAKSEIVIPFINHNGHCKFVLDVDAAEIGYFNESDIEYWQDIVQLFANQLLR